MSDLKSVVTTQPKKCSKISKFKAVTVVGLSTLALNAHAAAPAVEKPDVSAVLTYIGYAVGAVVAIGSAKMVPSAAMWLYSSLTSMVKRG